MPKTSSPTQPHPTTQSTHLSPTDRCDRCNAQAYVRVVLPNGSDLLFCGHHFGRHETALVLKDIDIVANDLYLLEAVS